MERGTFIAGFLAGTAGLITFLVIPALWIAPIWFISAIVLVEVGAWGKRGAVLISVALILVANGISGTLAFSNL